MHITWCVCVCVQMVKNHAYNMACVQMVKNHAYNMVCVCVCADGKEPCI